MDGRDRIRQRAFLRHGYSVPCDHPSHLREYYDTRAPEYDDWYLGLGRFAYLDPRNLAAELGGGGVLHTGPRLVMVSSRVSGRELG